MANQSITKPKIVFKNGRPAEVILRWKDFQEILEKIEDIADLGEIVKMKRTNPKFIDFDVLLKKYNVQSSNRKKGGEELKEFTKSHSKTDYLNNLGT